MSIEIKHRWNGQVIYTAENAQDIRTAVLEAIEKKTVLRGAVLRGAVLSGADLRGADLRGAVLSDAVLSGADLRGADLRGADLRGAVLSGAVLSGTVLSDAVLRGADLRGADLSDAVLSDADLSDAVLSGTVLSGAVLSGTVLSDADLSGTDLSGTDDHPRHPLYLVRQDVWAVLDDYPGEVAGLRAALLAGEVNGSVYSGPGGSCLVGTLCRVRGIDPHSLSVHRDSSRPAEQWYMPIGVGDKALAERPDGGWPSEGVFRASTALRWADEWLESRTAIAAALTAEGSVS